MQAAKKLKQKINSETLTTGMLVTDHVWPALVEIAVAAGTDYMIVDMEHGPHGWELVADVCAVGRLIDFPVLIRAISPGMETIRRTIDLGPCGLMLPSVDSAETLDQVRDSIYMPPRGNRRPGGRGNRWVHKIDYDTWRTEVEDDFIVLPQIETKTGLSNVEKIAGHEITTAMAIGPYDLSADLGVCGATTGPEVTAATQKIRKAARDVGKNMWVIGDGKALVEAGFTFLCITEPSSLLEGTLRGMVKQVMGMKK
ncbi:MAG: hypothetical protein HY326_03465 [Chloroflexi bacterium]|nr:hypothetical protein [Chloroflexota bacterium]